MEWVRLYHDMPTDPKWRVIAKKAGQRIGDVIAVFNFVLTNASSNTMKRGVTHGLVAEDIAAAIDLEESGVTAILDAMEGKVVKNGELLAWEKRNPIREDSSTDRVRKHRETQRNAVKRDVTLDKSREEQSREEQKEDGSAAPPAPAKPARKVTFALPDNFPDEAAKAAALGYWADRNRMDLIVADEAAAFRAHHRQHGNRMADWGQAWVTWYGRAVRFNKPAHSQFPTAKIITLGGN
jgi:hypothetical protein